LNAWIGKQLGVARTISILISCWALVTIGCAFFKTQAQVFALRLLIGYFEAGFYALCIYYFSVCYTRFDLGLRIGVFFGANSIAGGFSSLLAYGLLQIQGNLLNWQYLFIVEGVLTFGIGVFAFFYLPQKPEEAWFLTTEEKAFVADRIARDSGGEDPNHRGIRKKEVKMVLVDWKLWWTWPCNFLSGTITAVFSLFLPLIVQDLGYAGNLANLYAVPIYVVGTVGLLVIIAISDRYHIRLPLMLVCIGITFTGGVLVTQLESPKGRYVALCIMQIGAWAQTPVGNSFLANNTPVPGHRILLFGINSMCNIGGVVQSEIFLPKYAPTYKQPFYISLGMMSAAWLGFLGLFFFVRYQNRWRARKIASMTQEEIEEEISSDRRMSDKKWTFQYTI